MDFVVGLTQGFATLLSPSNLAACIVGTLIGLATAFLPGLGPAGAVALAFPIALALAPEAFVPNGFVIFLVSIAYGALHGRTLAAMNPGASNSTGAGPRVPAPARAGMIGGLLAGLAITILAAALSVFAKEYLLFFGPSEFAAATIFVLVAAIAFASGPAVGALAMTVLGLLLGAIGSDIETGTPRLTFGFPALAEGLDKISIAIGLFVIANAIRGLDPAAGHGRPDPASPTSGQSAAQVAGLVTARDACFSASLFFLLVIGFPIGVLAAVLMRIVTGLQTITDRSAATWLLFATLIAAHVVPLIIVALPGFGRWRPNRIDSRIVAPLVIACACLAVYSIDSNVIDVATMLVFGVVGYLMIRFQFDRAPLFIAIVFAPILEENIRRSLMISRGDIPSLLQRPIVAGLLIAAVVLVLGVRTWRHRRQAPRSDALAQPAAR